MKNANLMRAIREAEAAVREAEEVVKKTEQHTEDILITIEAELFRGVEGLKNTVEGDTLLMNTLEMLDVWHKTIEAEVYAEDLLLKKQTVLRYLLSK